MGSWIPIDSKGLNTPETREINGLSLDVFMSPYEIPTALRVDESDSDVVVIQFKYLDDESWTQTVRDDGIVARIGRHSKRLLGLEISRDLLKGKGSNVTLRILDPEVNRAIDHLESSSAGQGINRHYEVAKKAISQLDEFEFQETA